MGRWHKRLNAQSQQIVAIIIFTSVIAAICLLAVVYFDLEEQERNEMEQDAVEKQRATCLKYFEEYRSLPAYPVGMNDTPRQFWLDKYETCMEELVELPGSNWSFQGLDDP